MTKKPNRRKEKIDPTAAREYEAWVAEALKKEADERKKKDEGFKEYGQDA